jgi:osmoprotectant transport system substrate-binding protein
MGAPAAAAMPRAASGLAPGAGTGRRALLGLAAAATLGAGPAPLTVASKADTEGAILGWLIALSLRARGVPVRSRIGLGPTSILRQALLAGLVDLYPEYTGNGAQFFRQSGDPVWHDPAAAWERVRALDLARNGVVWLPPAPAENGWAIAVRQDFARAAGLASLHDLARAAGRVRLAASVEFAESRDALPAFERAYGFRLRQDQLLLLAGGNTAATLVAAARRLSGANAGMAYGTDGALQALDLVPLTDPLRAGIVFQPCPVVRAPALRAWPDLPAWLAPVFAALDAPALRRLNARVVVDGENAEAVARAFLARAA